MEQAQPFFSLTNDGELIIHKEGIDYVKDFLICSHCKLRSDYNKLLWAVESKFEDETRHETALRYIEESECSSGEACQCEEEGTS